MKKITLLLSLLLVVSGACQQRTKTATESETAKTSDSSAKAPNMTSGLNNEEEQLRQAKLEVLKLPEKDFVVKGKVIGGKGFVLILDRLEIGKTEPLESQTLNDEGEFKFTGKIRQADLYELRVSSDQSKVIHFPMFPGDDLYFTFDINHPENFQVNGSVEPIYLRDMYYTIEKTNEKIDAVEELQQNITDKAKLSRMADTLPHFYERIQKEKSANLRKFAMKVDTSFSALMATERLDAEYPENFEFMQKREKIFAKKYPYSPFYLDLHNKVTIFAPVSPGHILPDILLTDAKGKEYKPSQMPGKIVLLYFWNIDCKDCNDELPMLKQLYDKYKSKGFELVQVSLDNDRGDWMNAIDEKKLPGIQVNDIGLFKSTSAQTLLVSTTPYTFLLDKEGRIISKRQTIKELQKQLVKVFGF